jgi:hypothetical protein
MRTTKHVAPSMARPDYATSYVRQTSVFGRSNAWILEVCPLRCVRWPRRFWKLSTVRQNRTHFGVVERIRRTSRRDGRAHHACEDCWKTDFETLRQYNPRLFLATKHRHGTWREPQQQGDFCQCGPAVLCWDCKREIRPVPTYIFLERNRIMQTRSKKSSSIPRYSRDCEPPPPHYECKGCTMLLGPRDRHITNFFCHLCNLPMRMRNSDHPLERQSKVLTPFRDDEHYNTFRVGADYESVE